MGHFRKFEGPELMGQKLQKIEDYQTGESVDLASQTKQALNFPKSNVLGFYFQNGDCFFLRPSGTEPKIKFYIMICEREGDLVEKKTKAHRRAADFGDFIREQAEIV